MADIDEKVVQLTLDNKSFEKDTEHTIKSLDELKDSLRFEGIGKGFDEITSSAKRVDLNPIEKGVIAVSNQFDALTTIADAAFRNITNKAIDSGERLIKSLSIDQVTSGWSKFEDKTRSVATLLAQGFNMDEVNEQLDKLNWFTDETSYNFTEMVANISKFTATGKGLKDSTTAMEGIALWAALSGQNAQTASHAMYQLSQALGAGTMRLEDYRSIQNASMDTDEFRQKALDAAVALGTLEKVGENTYKSLVGGGEAFNKSQFATNLTEGAWFTSNVMMKVFTDYSSAVDQIYEYAEEKGISASQAIEELGDVVDEFGLKAFLAGQEARTWGDALDSVKDAVSTGWMQTFEYIIGDSREATELFTDVANSLYDAIVESGNVRNEILRDWKDLGGRNLLIDSLKTMVSNLWEVVEIVKDGVHEIFPPATLDTVVNLTNKFAIFAARFKLTEGSARNLKDIISGIMSVLRGGITIAKTLFKALSPIFELFNGISGLLLEMTGNLARMTRSGIDKLISTKNMEKLYTVVNSIAKVIAGLASGSLSVMLTIGKKIADVVSNIWDRFSNEGGGISGFITITVSELQSLWDSFSYGDTLLNKVVDAGLFAIGGLATAIGGLADIVIGLIRGEDLDLTTKFGDVQGWVELLGTELEKWGVKSLFDAMITSIQTFIFTVQNFVQQLFTAESDVRTVMSAIANDMMWLYDLIKDWLKDLSVQDIQGFIVIFMLWQFINSMKEVNVALKGVFTAFSGTIGAATNILKEFSDPKGSFVDKLNGIFNKTKILQIGVSALLLVQALRILTDMDQERLIQSVLTLGLVAGLMIAVMKQLQKLNEASSKIEKKGGGMGFATQFLALSTGVFIVAQSLKQMVALFNDPNLEQGALLGAIATIVSAIVALSGAVILIDNMSKGAGNLYGASAALIAMAAAVGVLTSSIMALKGSSYDDLAPAVTGLAVVLIALGSAAALLSKADWSSLLASSVAFVSMAASINLMAVAIAGLSNLDDISNGLAGVAVSALAMVTVLGVLGSFADPTKLMATSAALIAMGAAMVAFAGSLAILSNIDILFIVEALAALTIAIGAIAAIGTLGGTGLLMAAALLAAVGVAAAGIGAGLLMAAAAAIKFVEAGALFVGFIIGLGVIVKEFGDELPKIIDGAFEALYTIISDFLMMIVALSPQFSLAAAALIGSIAGGIMMSIGEIKAATAYVILGILDVLSKVAAPLMDALIKIVEDLNERLPALMDAIGLFVERLFAGIGTLIFHSILGMIEMLFNAIGLSGIGKQITDKMRTLGEKTADDLTGGVVDGVKANQDEIEKAAAAIPNAAAMGLSLNKDAYVNANKNLAQEGLDAFDNTIEYHSPPDEYIDRGESIPGAAASGIESNADVYNKANEDLAQGGLDKMTETILSGSDQITNAMDTTMKDGLNGLDLDQFEGFLELPGLLDTSATYKQIADVKTAIIDLDKWMIGRNSKLGMGSNAWGKSIESTIEGIVGSAKEEASDGGKEVGTEFTESVGEGIISSPAGAAGARAQARTIADAFKDEIEKLDLDQTTDELLYKLWGAKNPNATDAEKNAAEIAYTNKKIAYSTKELEIQRTIYEQTVDKYGENSEEAVKAFQSFVQAQIDLIDLQNKLAELQNQTVTSSSDNAKKFLEFSKAVGESYAYLKAEGFSDEQIRNSLANEVGWKQPLMQNAQNLSEGGKEAARATANSVVGTYSDTLVNGMVETIPKLTEVGKNGVEAISSGMKDNVDLIAAASSEMAQTTVDTMKPEWLEVGRQVDAGLEQGIEDNSDGPVNASGNVSQQVIDKAKSTAGVHSPSTEFIYIGQMMMEGLRVGIMQKVQVIAEAAAAAVRAAIRAARAAAGINSPATEGIYIGEMFDLGIAKGTKDYAFLVSEGASRVIEDAVEEASNAAAKNPIDEYISNALGGKDNTIVIDVDATALDAALEEYQKVRDDANKASAALAQNRAKAKEMIAAMGGLVTINGNQYKTESYDMLYNRYMAGFDKRAQEISNMLAYASSAVSVAGQLAKMEAYNKQLAEKYDTSGMVVNFTQNNTSPQPLTRADIYRDTKKQLESFKSSLDKNAIKRR